MEGLATCDVRLACGRDIVPGGMPPRWRGGSMSVPAEMPPRRSQVEGRMSFKRGLSTFKFSTRDDLNRPERGSVEGRRNDVARIRSKGRKAPRSGRAGTKTLPHPLSRRHTRRACPTLLSLAKTQRTQSRAMRIERQGLCSLPKLGVLGGLARNLENLDRGFASCFPCL